MSKTFAKEVDLCAAFLAEVEREKGWTAYPETEGFDIVLARKVDGVQVGIEAKLALNSTVIMQALEGAHGWAGGVLGPDYRAVLVPFDATKGLAPICNALGLTVITCERPSEYRRGRGRFWPPLPRGQDNYFRPDWHEWCPIDRLKLPDYVPDVAAGASAPARLTDWKIKAIKLVILLAERPVTRADFKFLGLDPSRWTEPVFGWLVKAPSGERAYVAGSRLPDFRAQHPRVFDEIVADKAKWAPAALITKPKQEVML